MSALNVVSDEEWKPYFEAALKETLAEITISVDIPARFSEGMFNAFLKGDNRLGKRVAMQYLPDGSWRWTDEPDDEDEYPDLEELVSRMFGRVYLARRKASFLDNVADRPYWMLTSLPHCRCYGENGKVFRYDASYWDRPMPCSDKKCACSIRALDEQDIQERGLTVLKD